MERSEEQRLNNAKVTDESFCKNFEALNGPNAIKTMLWARHLTLELRKDYIFLGISKRKWELLLQNRERDAWAISCLNFNLANRVWVSTIGMGMCMCVCMCVYGYVYVYVYEHGYGKSYKISKSKKLMAKLFLEIPVPAVKFCVCNGLAHIFWSTLVGFFNLTGTHF